jgi:hypothetical protein
MLLSAFILSIVVFVVSTYAGVNIILGSYQKPWPTPLPSFTPYPTNNPVPTNNSVPTSTSIWPSPTPTILPAPTQTKSPTMMAPGEIVTSAMATFPTIPASLGSSIATGAASAVALVKNRKVTKPVMLGASAPQTAKSGGEFTARFVAYNKGLEKKVQSILKSLSPTSSVNMGVKKCNWQTGTKVKVVLSGKCLVCRNAEQEFVWEGGYSILDFDVEILPEAPEGVVVLKFDVLIEGFMVAGLRFDLSIVSDKVSNEISVVETKPAYTAFASYASEDRQRVLDRVDAVSISAGLDVFLDCLSMHPSEKWKNRLQKEIHNRELFLLFWSKEAENSQYVAWEWHMALKEKGVDAMQIQPLQPVFEVPPPEELKDLHFGSPYMLARKAYESCSCEKE